MLISGPSFMMRVTAIHTPVAAATMGMTQTREIRVRFLGTVLASVTLVNFSLSDMLNLFWILRRVRGIPNQPRIE